MTLEGAVISYDSFQNYSSRGAEGGGAGAGAPELSGAFGGAAASADNELLDLGLEPVHRAGAAAAASAASASAAAVGGSGTSGVGLPPPAHGPAPPPYSAAVASNGAVPGSGSVTATATAIAAASNSTTLSTASSSTKPGEPASAAFAQLLHMPPAATATKSPALLPSPSAASSSNPNAVNLMLDESPVHAGKPASSASGKSDLLDIDFFASSSGILVLHVSVLYFS